MTRCRIVFLPLLIGACAPAAGTEPATPRVEMPAVQTVVGGAKITHESMNAPQALPMRRERAWSGLQAAFDSVGLTVRNRDEAAGILGSGNQTVNGRLKGVRLSRLLNCGTNHGVENADSYEVEMVVTSQVTAAGEGVTTLATAVQGWAKPRGTAGSNRLTCGTTGQLERRIAELVLAAG
jgi:hypothetical protein